MFDVRGMFPAIRAMKAAMTTLRSRKAAPPAQAKDKPKKARKPKGKIGTSLPTFLKVKISAGVKKAAGPIAVP